MTSKNNLLIFGVLFLLVLIPNISALGITPGRTTVDFSPNLERDIQFTLINSEKKDMNVAFTIEGDLQNLIELTSDVIHFKAGEDSKNFNYKIKLPSNLSPGLHKTNIIAVELPPDMENQETIVRATISVVTQLYVYVPYPGKYIDATFNIVNNEENKKILFYIPVISRGEEKISKVKGTIEIYKNNQKIKEINTNEFSINTQEKKELSAAWEKDVVNGSYKAIATIVYDNEKPLVIEKNFVYGDEFISLLGVSTDDFHLGEVARIKVLVQNKQLEKISEAIARFKIYDNELSKVAEMNSESYEILPLANKEMVVYWDTANIQEGHYDSEIKIDYDDKFMTKNLGIDITQDSMKFVGTGFAISSGGEKKFSSTGILTIVIGILVLVNLMWFLRWMRKKHRKNK
jgi:hypothetical protein